MPATSTTRSAGWSAGEITPVRPGAYVVGVPPDGAAARHALQLGAALEYLADGAVASHVSAAVLHGLPTWGLSLEHLHVSRDRRSGGRVGRHVHVHVAPLHAEEVVAALLRW